MIHRIIWGQDVLVFFIERFIDSWPLMRWTIVQTVARLEHQRSGKQVAILLWMEEMAQGKDQGKNGTWLQLSKCHPLLSCLFMHEVCSKCKVAHYCGATLSAA